MRTKFEKRGSLFGFLPKISVNWKKGFFISFMTFDTLLCYVYEARLYEMQKVPKKIAPKI